MHRIALFAFAAALLAGCSKKVESPAVQNPAAAVPRMTEAEFAESIPAVGGSEGYTGSQSCKPCHEDQFKSWHRTYHRTMTQFATPEAVQADFNNVVLTNDKTRVTLQTRNSEYWAKFERLDTNSAAEIRLGLVTGSHHMQVFWVPEGHGNMQIGFPFTWLIPEKRWVPRNSTFIRPPEMGHRSEAWNISCSRCHTTGVEPHADIAARRIETQVAELGISCEACHGPGQKHADAQLAARDRPGPKKVAAGEIVHPEELDPARASQVCGFCHSMKWISSEENWRESGFRFRPGDDLDKTTPVIRPNRVDEIAGLANYLNRNPEILDEFFWPDGMIRVSGREYNGLIESPCYKGGKFSCLSCHSLHESEPDDLLALRARSNEACLQCHEKFVAPEAAMAHSRHKAGSPGNDCYNCHMPHTTYGVLKAIRSHQVSSPRAADQLASGRPNACNLCHLDKTLEWTADHLLAWHNQPKPPLGGAATNVSAMVQYALLGDAGQRALAAWHLAWEPALRASGTNWTAAILAQLLDDPYAAIRCVAERAMKQAAPSLLPAGYDFTVEPKARPLVRGSVWQAWKTELAAGSETNRPALLLSPGNLDGQSAAFEEKLVQRDNRPVRLRE